jgi:leucyl/phenylalanyl-tRNA--protein transferase
MSRPLSQPETLVQHLLEAYRRGYFPMADPEGHAGTPGAIVWLNPDPRGILPLTEDEGLHWPRRLRERVRSRRFVISADRAFEEVMRGCAEPRPGELGTWIDERFVGAYGLLHEAGHAHSVEAWVVGERDGTSTGGTPVSRVLVGGVYGVHIGGAFFAESKFCRPALGGTDASKVCLVHLVQHLMRRGFVLLDTQFWNAHIGQFGCREIPRAEYLRRLTAAAAMEVSWGVFEPEAAVGAV